MSAQEKGKSGLAVWLAAVKALVHTIMHECYIACQQAEAIMLNSQIAVLCLPIAQQFHLPCMAVCLQPVEPTRAFPGVLFPSLPTWLGAERALYNLMTNEMPT